MEEIEKSNNEVINKMKSSQPFLMDVVPAKSVIDILNNMEDLHITLTPAFVALVAFCFIIRFSSVICQSSRIYLFSILRAQWPP